MFHCTGGAQILDEISSKFYSHLQEHILLKLRLQSTSHGVTDGQ